MSARRLNGHVASRAYIRAHGLDEIDCQMLSDTVRAAAPAWSAEAHRDPSGEISLMVVPPDADDAAGPTLVIHRVAAALHMDQFRWDNYAPIGEYQDLEAVLRAVRHLLQSLPLVSGGSMMLH
jgi:hypothetical protein